LWLEKREVFDPLVTSLSSKADAICIKIIKSNKHGKFSDYDKDMITELERMADTSEAVMRESEYKEKRNPEAWQHEQEKLQLQKKHAQDIAAAKKEGAKESIKEIDRLNKLLKDAEKVIESVKPGNQKSVTQQAGAK
jgi:hypothetical protein